jgi:dephospho-CoA kinase
MTYNIPVKKIILAVAGLAGSGKSEASEYIAQRTGWPKIHFGNMVTDETSRRGMELTQENERVVREEYRAKLGMGALALMAMPKIKEYAESADGVIVESMYSWEEYLELLKEFGDQFKVLAIFASPQTRGLRMAKRPLRPLEPEELKNRDFTEIETLHKAGPIARADYMIVNEGRIDDLKSELDGFLEKLGA